MLLTAVMMVVEAGTRTIHRARRPTMADPKPNPIRIEWVADDIGPSRNLGILRGKNLQNTKKLTVECQNECHTWTIEICAATPRRVYFLADVKRTSNPYR